ncbi:MAG: hypothetical protein KY475_16985 [Planctomycetes bacterium]|nr:hypothetical protein [Planctomycetota bacterium]
MSSASPPFHEGNFRSKPIRDLGLTIEGTRLAPLIRQFEQELRQAGVCRLRPEFHLSTEWGVPFGTIVIGIPFYLAHPELVEVHARHVGHVEGVSDADILRYFRHEMGHVVNYAYKLYNDEEWIKHFGSLTQPYVEDYRPAPFSTRYVVHLPGWYAQKHPDEDWSETFAVWMTPESDWRSRYAGWPKALAKLEYCDRKMAELADCEPLVSEVELDEDVGELAVSVEQYYRRDAVESEDLPVGLEGSLRAIFEDLGRAEESHPEVPRHAASELIRRLEQSLMADVYRWTGHFPERTRLLLRRMAEIADELQQVYPLDREVEAAVAVTTFVTSLATNYVHRGSYLA